LDAHPICLDKHPNSCDASLLSSDEDETKVDRVGNSFPRAGNQSGKVRDEKGKTGIFVRETGNEKGKTGNHFPETGTFVLEAGNQNPAGRNQNGEGRKLVREGRDENPRRLSSLKLFPMSILTIELPEETMTVLQRIAQERGETVESIAREWVQTKSENEQAAGEWMKLAGIFSSGTPDLAERHDHYLVEEMMNNHADEK